MRRLNILVIEDDEATGRLLVAALEEAEHRVLVAPTIAEGRSILDAERPDIIVLDRGLPDGDGLKLCIELRKDSRYRAIPLLMLTGNAETAERIIGLRYGADDYLGKPFDMEEFLARVDGLIRRLTPELFSSSNRLVCGPISMFIPGRQVTVSGKEVPLGNVEYELLRVLMERAGTALSRDLLLEMAWKQAPGEVCAKAVDVAVMSLRRKLGAAGASIEAVRGCGYRMAAPDSGAIFPGREDPPAT